MTRHFKFDHAIYTMTIIHYVSLKIPEGAPASGAPLVPTPMYIARTCSLVANIVHEESLGWEKMVNTHQILPTSYSF